MVVLLLAAAVGVVVRAPWMTILSAPGRVLLVQHTDPTPLWSPPSARPIADVLATLDRSSDWHGVDAAKVTRRVVADRETMLVNLLMLLVPATLLPGWLYTRVRGRERDLVLHLGCRAGCGVAAGLLASLALWVAFGGWGPPSFVLFGLLGLALGLTTGALSSRDPSARRRPTPRNSP
jgi:hypothetical protein